MKQGLLVFTLACSLVCAAQPGNPSAPTPFHGMVFLGVAGLLLAAANGTGGNKKRE